MQKLRIAFMTLGCKVNYYETEKLTEQFASKGNIIVPFSDYADVYVVNTCTVTAIADRKSRKMLHRARKLNENAVIAAMGCFAQTKKDTLCQEENIDIVISNQEKSDAYDIIMENVKMNAEKLNRSFLWVSDQIIDLSDRKHENEEDKGENGVKERTRAYIKIQDGCNQFCTYCKIPYVRGKLKSRDEDSVVNEIKELVAEGYKEVVLTGIHVSSYGVDKCSAKSFIELEGKPLAGLLERIEKETDIVRIRLSSLEPRIITDSFVKKIAANKKLCPHFHLSLQSGCDKTLANMNRKYTSAEYMQACETLRKYYDKPAITTDVIVGFPGESDKDYEISRQFVEDIGFADIHVFKYSPRSGTKAADYPDQINGNIKDARSHKMIETGNKLTEMYIDSMMGTKQLALIEEKVLISGKYYWIGHNERYVKLTFAADDEGDYENCLVWIVPERIIAAGTLEGRITANKLD